MYSSCVYLHSFGQKNFNLIQLSVDRLRTIISYDRICVLDAGQIAEFDTPSNLYQQAGRIFRGMCEQSSITWDDIRLAVKAKEG